MNKITYEKWDGRDDNSVYLFRISNASGSFIELTNYGASVVSVNVPDKKSNIGNVILGFPTLKGYLDDECYIGSTIGRFANRISDSSFVLDDVKYILDDNDNGNSNHGGSAGFNSKVFDFSIEDNVLSFNLLSVNGDSGFPGNLKLKVDYQWTDNNELIIDYSAITDQNTVANFTNHAYFNLSSGTKKIFDHELLVFADLVVETGADYIPTGRIVPSAGFSFNGDKIRKKMTIDDDYISGLNICYSLNKKNNESLAPACVLVEEQSGRVMEVFTSYPGLLLYTGDFLNSRNPGHLLKNYEPFDGLCLECQYFPDSPNCEHFPSTVLHPEDTYKHSIIFRFSIKT